MERGEEACGDLRPVALPTDRGDGANLHAACRVQPRDVRPAGFRHRRRREAHQGPAAIRSETGRLHHRAAMAPIAGVPDTTIRLRRDADGDDRTQGTGTLGPVLDAGREGARPEEPTGSDCGETAGWTPGTAIR